MDVWTYGCTYHLGQKRAHTCIKVHLLKCRFIFCLVIIIYELNMFFSVGSMAYFGDFDHLGLPWNRFVEA
jgi:hypothetical protein